jgi:NAD+ kinase
MAQGLGWSSERWPKPHPATRSRGFSTVHDVLLVHQPYVPATLAVAQTVVTHLERREIPFRLCSAHELANEPRDGVRLAVCFGGDGTALRTARWLSGSRAPVVPVRMGKLSFLGELAPTDLPLGLDPYLNGDFWRDERAMLRVERGLEQSTGLNDVVLVRSSSPRAVHVEVVVDGAHVVTYLADGVIVATATGSTAYSRAAGGPVLAPSMRSMVVTPIAPHLTALRSLVLPAEARVELINRGYAAEVLTVDGQVDLSVEPGAGVTVTLAPETSVFARRGPPAAFFEGLAAKLSRG